MTPLERASLRDKILGNSKLVFGFEVVPPVNNGEGIIRENARVVLETIGSEISSIDALLLPDVDNEETGANGRIWNRNVAMQPRDYAEILKETTIKKDVPVDIMLHRRTVATPSSEQKIWLVETARMGYLNIIPVGGDSSTKRYVGISPIEFARMAQSIAGVDYLLGAICIPTRGMMPRQTTLFAPNPELEPSKMLEKENAGISYHVTQILYEIQHLERMYNMYRQRCEDLGRMPSRILIGVAPITKNFKFLEWLGVVVPEEAKARILRANDGIAQRSIQYIVDMLKGFFDKLHNQDSKTKLGVYVECINPRNLGISVELFGRLRESLYS